MEKLNVEVWADGDEIKAFKFSDGYAYSGHDAAIKMNKHFKSKPNAVGKMRIHDWKPIGIKLAT